jgi:deoxyribodipyrimidine photo-lyase
MGRDFPGQDATSRLSPHLRHGEISSRQVWHAALALEAHDVDHAGESSKLLSELSWRDFNYHQLYHRPDIATQSMQPRLSNVAYRSDPDVLKRWQRGKTGIPIIDAGMRELWETGWMQNRVRMLTASFLAKNLLADWRVGEAWFWDTLVDADPANNAGNWQWIAGTGFDAAPFFRVFNPVTQGERFDAEGTYVRRFVPELAKLPAGFVHRPFEAPKDVLEKAGIILSESYPLPLVDLSVSRQAALDAFRSARASPDQDKT